MKKDYIRSIWLLCCAFFVFLSFLSCEVRSSDLIEIDENGNVINNNEINIGTSLLDVGMNAYAEDSVYTELIMTRHKNGDAKIVGFRKGDISYYDNGTISSLSWHRNKPVIRYGYDYTYVYNGYEYKILSLEDHGFVEDMEIWKDGSLYVQLKYHYDRAGYLSNVYLLNMQSVVYFKYNYRNSQNRSNTITIIEQPGSREYTIRLAPKRIENKGYICNVLRYAHSPLTNEFIINPDLYYLGIYGTPVKYLPDEAIERGAYRDKKGNVESVFSRVGNYKYFYE